MARYNEYETTEQYEMAYLYYLGFPHEFDRSNEHKVKMIFKGDVVLITGKLKDFWDCDTKVDARGLLNAFKEIKQSIWIGGKYNPDVYRKPVDSVIHKTKTNETDNSRPADQQEK